MPGQEAYCADCGAPFIRYTTLRKYCDEHQRERERARQAAKLLKQRKPITRSNKPLNVRKPLQRNRKPIRQHGKIANQWRAFREKVAVPFLDKKFGHVCSVAGCGATTGLDVDHIKPRGSHPELRFDVTNLRYLCRPHHIERTGVAKWSRKDA